jgi:2-polyprenyl-3-methyl-5-hydroxy-6-metoxy-1,4-benzoquinol methylase
MKSTNTIDYTNRLVSLQESGWKKRLRRFDPYGIHIRRVCNGPTLEVGCGIGRLLQFLPKGSIGVDHNSNSIDHCISKGLDAFTSDSFEKSQQSLRGKFDFLLLSHLLEHMSQMDAVQLILGYKHWIKDDGKVVVICPQEKGFASDSTHIEFMDFEKIGQIVREAGFEVLRSYSFPFPRFVGSTYIYNEFVSIGRLIT